MKTTKPTTRKAQYFDLLKWRLGLFVKTSLVLTLFAFPLFVWLALCAYNDQAIYSAVDFNNVEAAKVYLQTFITNRQIKLIVLLPCLALFALGWAGASKIAKNFVHANSLWFWQDFKQGVKENGGRFVLLFFLFGVALNIVALINSFCMFDQYRQFYALSWAVYIVTVYFCGMLLMFSCHLLTMYKLKIGQVLHNALILVVKKLPLNLLLFAVSFAPYFVLFVFNIPGVVVIVLLICAVVGNGHAMYCSMLHAYNIFDNFINKKHYPEVYRKGLEKLGYTECNVSDS